MRERIPTIVLLLIVFSSGAVGNDRGEYLIQTHLFLGSQNIEKTGPQITISSSAQLALQSPDREVGDLESKDVNLIIKDLGTIYQLNNFEFLASSQVIWNGEKDAIRSTIFLDKKMVPIKIAPQLLSENRVNLHIEIFKLLEEPEQARIEDLSSDSILLDTEIVLTPDKPIVLGFPSNGNTYFLSIVIFRQAEKELLGSRLGENVEEINILQPPVPIYRVTPDYPQECKDLGVEGQVILEINTSSSGNVTSVRLIKSAHPLLDNSAAEALKQWRFTPPKRKQKSVPVLFNVTIDFKLRDQEPQDSASATGLDKDLDPELAKILVSCAKYCDRVYQSALHFVCEEKIKEKKYEYGTDSRVRFANSIEDYLGAAINRSRAPTRTIKNVYLYDYQLINKDGAIQETRVLLEENGASRNEKNAKLKTTRFYSEKSIFGPVGFLSRDWHSLYDYKLKKSGKVNGRKVYIIDAFPKTSILGKPNYGRIWVDKEDFSILRIDVEMESLPGFEAVKKESNRQSLKPIITVRHEYFVEKKGIRFPSKTVFKEAYTSPEIRRIKRSELEIIYDKYRFFIVDTEIKY